MEHEVATSYDDVQTTLAVTCKKTKMVSFASSIMRDVVAP